MDDEQIWSIYFAGVCSMQYHPRNNINYRDEREFLAITWAANAADAMLAEHHKRWPVEKEEPCLGS